MYQYALTIDHEGNLYTCCEKAGDPKEMIGRIQDFDPDHAEETALHPELVQFYSDVDSLMEACGDCVFLPRCKGECPAKRRKGKPECPGYKEDPDAYVLYIYRKLKENKDTQKPASNA